VTSPCGNRSVGGAEGCPDSADSGRSMSHEKSIGGAAQGQMRSLIGKKTTTLESRDCEAAVSSVFHCKIGERWSLRLPEALERRVASASTSSASHSRLASEVAIPGSAGFGDVGKSSYSRCAAERAN
jgi:hypothetical protein